MNWKQFLPLICMQTPASFHYQRHVPLQYTLGIISRPSCAFRGSLGRFLLYNTLATSLTTSSWLSICLSIACSKRLTSPHVCQFLFSLRSATEWEQADSPVAQVSPNYSWRSSCSRGLGARYTVPKFHYSLFKLSRSCLQDSSLEVCRCRRNRTMSQFDCVPSKFDHNCRGTVVFVRPMVRGFLH